MNNFVLFYLSFKDFMINQFITEFILVNGIRVFSLGYWLGLTGYYIIIIIIVIIMVL